MRLAVLMGAAFGLGSIAGGCTSDLQLALEGKRCSANGRCIAGYECDTIVSLCVPEGTLRDGGGLGGSGWIGNGGRGGDGGVGGNAGGGSLGGLGGRAGSGSPDGGGAAGAAGSWGGAAGTPNDLDGGLGTLPDGGCVPTIVYHDLDGDTFGDSSDSTVACPSDEWVTAGRDCRDDLVAVHPGQTNHFAVGYSAPTPPGASPPVGFISFDYDCSNSEVPDQTNDTNDAAPNCGALLGVGCNGRGFEPASPLRSGPDIEPRCGSNVRRDCEGDGLTTCDPFQTTVDESEAFRCK